MYISIGIFCRMDILHTWWGHSLFDPYYVKRIITLLLVFVYLIGGGQNCLSVRVENSVDPD